ncbi:hypothetical protein [Nocardia xishanensis]|uniref:hypothetical protein n=1 Tax=Nocardia xishanensis TaxID=238964 RepID=UPI00082D452A|nr:hypothetical protein [Nocardia xishanensis]
MPDRDTLADIVRQHVSYDHQQATVDAILAAGWQPPARVIESVDELDRLQSAQALTDARDRWESVVPAVIEDARGHIYERDVDNVESELSGGLPHAGWWKTGTDNEDYDSSTIPLPVKVLRRPLHGGEEITDDERSNW